MDIWDHSILGYSNKIYKAILILFIVNRFQFAVYVSCYGTVQGDYTAGSGNLSRWRCRLLVYISRKYNHGEIFYRLLPEQEKWLFQGTLTLVSFALIVIVLVLLVFCFPVLIRFINSLFDCQICYINIAVTSFTHIGHQGLIVI